jgi:acetoin utilization deacetylase AcuC-like enzyme
MTRAGLRARDRLVLRSLGERGIPTVLLLSGGYAATPELTADLHAEAHRAAAEPDVIALRARCGAASGDD